MFIQTSNKIQYWPHTKLQLHNYSVRDRHYHKVSNTHVFIIENFMCHLSFVVLIYITIVLLVLIGSLAVSTTIITIGKFAIASAFSMIYVYSTEIFPTVLRTAGLGSCSACGRAGAFVATFAGLLVCTPFQKWSTLDNYANFIRKVAQYIGCFC